MKPEDRDLGKLLDGVGATADRAKEVAADLADGARTVVVKRIPRRREKPMDLSTLPDEAKLLYCRILARQAKSDRLLDPREISNLYLFASTIGLDAESRTVLRREITAAPADTEGSDGEADDALALTVELSDLLDDARAHGGPGPAREGPALDLAGRREVGGRGACAGDGHRRTRLPGEGGRDRHRDRTAP